MNLDFNFAVKDFVTDFKHAQPSEYENYITYLFS